MKISFLYLTLLPTLLCLGCMREESLTSLSSPMLQGGEILAFNSSSRSSQTQYLPSGSQITFYSQGGIQADESLLTYNGNSWEGDLTLSWAPEEPHAQTCTFYPPLYRENQPLYQEGSLQDILYCRKDFQRGELLQLTFRHLFAQINFQLSAQLNQEVEHITFTTSSSVDHILPETAQINLQDTPVTLIMSPNPEGLYSFLLPPAALSICLQITTRQGNELKTTLENQTFQGGHAYTCQVKQSGETPGIETTEDFIAFTYLINGKPYGNRSLEEFGETTGGITTYYLHNDLTFTSEESAQVQMIGKYGQSIYSQKKTFNDIFDGQGHSLSHLTFNKPTEGSYYSGLFSGISESGIVRNLILDQAIYDNPDDTDDASFLAGINQGTIENCILRNCVIQDIDKGSEFGHISSLNNGTIINCQLDNTSIKTDINYGNGIARYNDGGKILNCLVTNCNFSKAKLGGALVCNRTRNGEIQNCYCKGSSGKCNAISLIAEGSNIIRCCFYPQSYTKAPVGNNYVSSPSDSIMKYGSSQKITEENLFQVLNRWVSGSGPQQHPTLSFLPWKQGENLPALLVFP